MFGGWACRASASPSRWAPASSCRADGVIVTNHHVIEGGQEITVVAADRREFPAKVLLADPRADLAVLKIDAGRRDACRRCAIDDRDDVQVGDLVLAIGDPFGVGQTVTNGIVSALARSDVGVTDVSYFIQTDAAINPGNSGGAAGRHGRRPDRREHRHPLPLGHLVRRRLRHPRRPGRARWSRRPWAAAARWCGPGWALKTQAVTGEIARAWASTAPQGVLVADVWPGGPAARAGLKQGDVILAVDGQPVNDEAALNYHVLTAQCPATP